MTTLEAATELNVSPRRVQALIKDGRLKATRHGRDWWIEPQDLEAVRERPNGYPKGKPRK